MFYDGMKFRRAHKIAFRDPREGECYVGKHAGEPIKMPYCTFVRMRDCDPPDLRGIWYPRTAKKIIPLTGHSATNMAYGPWRERKGHFGLASVWECTVYLAYDGRCYTHLIKRDSKPAAA